MDKLRDAKIDLVQLDGCLITHEHQDHAKFALEVAKYTRIYSSQGTLDKLDLRRLEFQKRPIEVNKTYAIGTFTVIPFEVEHDAAEPFGYLIYSRVTKEKLLFATDTYYIKKSV